MAGLSLVAATQTSIQAEDAAKERCHDLGMSCGHRPLSFHDDRPTATSAAWQPSSAPAWPTGRIRAYPPASRSHSMGAFSRVRRQSRSRLRVERETSSAACKAAELATLQAAQQVFRSARSDPYASPDFLIDSHHCYFFIAANAYWVRPISCQKKRRPHTAALHLVHFPA